MALEHGPDGVPGAYPEREVTAQRQAAIHRSMKKACLVLAGVTAGAALFWGFGRRRR
jgi:hypothetical protein